MSTLWITSFILFPPFSKLLLYPFCVQGALLEGCTHITQGGHRQPPYWRTQELAPGDPVRRWPTKPESPRAKEKQLLFPLSSVLPPRMQCHRNVHRLDVRGSFHVDQSGLEGVESGEAHWGVPAESNCTVLVGKLLTLLPQQLWSILSEVLHLETYFSGLLILIKRSYKSIGQMPVREKHAKSMCRYFASAKGQRRSWMWSTPVTLECRLENGFRRVLGWYPVVPLILQIPPRRALSLHSP